MQTLNATEHYVVLLSEPALFHAFLLFATRRPSDTAFLISQHEPPVARLVATASLAYYFYSRKPSRPYVWYSSSLTWADVLCMPSSIVHVGN